MAGVQAWMSGYAIRKLEIFYRTSLTYALYVIIIRLLLVLLIQFKVLYTLTYIGDFILNFLIIRPVIDNFII